MATGSDDFKVIIWKEKSRPKEFGKFDMEITWAEHLVLS